MLVDDNHYVEVFKLAKEIFEQQDSPSNIKIVINEDKKPMGEYARRYYSPVSDKIAVLMPNDNVNNRDIVLHYRDGGLRHISELHILQYTSTKNCWKSHLVLSKTDIFCLTIIW